MAVPNSVCVLVSTSFAEVVITFAFFDVFMNFSESLKKLNSAYKFISYIGKLDILSIYTVNSKLVYLGISGYCYPFEDDSVIVSMLSGSWGQRCQQMDPLLPMSQGGHFDVVQHVPLYMTIAGSGDFTQSFYVIIT